MIQLGTNKKTRTTTALNVSVAEALISDAIFSEKRNPSTAHKIGTRSAEIFNAD